MECAKIPKISLRTKNIGDKFVFIALDNMTKMSYGVESETRTVHDTLPESLEVTFRKPTK